MGHKVYIRALELDDFKTTIEWRKEDGLWDNLIGARRFVSSYTEERWVEKSIKEHEKGERLRLAVCLNEDNQLIGLVTFSNIDLINGNCEISYVIAKEYRGKGFFSEMSTLAINYIFSQFPLHRISARVINTNIISDKALKKYGFKKEGVLQEAVLKNGNYEDLILYCLLRDDFYAGPGRIYCK